VTIRGSFRSDSAGGAIVAQRVHGVDAQAVDVEVPQPHLRVVDDVAADLLGVRAVEVERGPPDVGAGEVGPEAVEVGPGRPEVVVDDVEQHAHAAGVAGVDEPLEGVGAAVVLGDGVPADAVVPPVARPVDGVDRQHFDQVDAQVGEVVEALDRGVERAGRGERADVQLVEDAAGQLAAGPGLVCPDVPAAVVEPGGAVHAAGLPAGARVGQRGLVVAEQEGVGGPRLRSRHVGVPPAGVAGGHGMGGPVHQYANPVVQRCPHREVSHARHLSGSPR
jgi:hypothetical protein